MPTNFDDEFCRNISRPLSAIAVSYANGHRELRHTHPRGELLCAESGTIRVATDNGAWIVPPYRAVWIPPHCPHQTAALSASRMHVLFIRADACPAGAPSVPRILPASSLFLELVRSAAMMPLEYDESGREGRIVALLLDEIQWNPLHLPQMPALRDTRLLTIEQALVADLADTRTLQQWAETAGASTRTLSRLFREEAGMSFRSWREQFRVLTAISRLMEGTPVTALAGDFGYETPGAFTAMFKRVLGVTPSQYLSDTLHVSLRRRLRQA